MALENLKKHINSTLEYCENEKQEWLIKFKENSFNALSWSDGMVDVCAQEHVYQQIKNAVENHNVSIESLQDSLQKEVLMNAGLDMRNKLNRAVLKANANCLEQIKQLKRNQQ